MNKICAIIPARAGSKGIPNKNIRIIGGHPLIYYSILNALRSDYITDVIVSTDSPDVGIIANQMGAKVKWRDAKLCEDSVTLDSVVADAIPEGDWDYVITMQPTSPTLKTETLDSAIEYAVSNDIDTVISVINSPHLALFKKLCYSVYRNKIVCRFSKNIRVGLVRVIKNIRLYIKFVS